MPEKYTVIIASIMAGITGIGIMLIQLRKNFNLSGQVELQAKDNAKHREKVDEILAGQNTKLSLQRADIAKVEENIVKLRANVTGEFVNHREFITEGYMNKPEVLEHFNRLEHAREDLADRVIGKIDGIETFLRDEQRSKLEALTRENEELRRLKDK